MTITNAKSCAEFNAVVRKKLNRIVLEIYENLDFLNFGKKGHLLKYQDLKIQCTNSNSLFL